MMLWLIICLDNFHTICLLCWFACGLVIYTGGNVAFCLQHLALIEMTGCPRQAQMCYRKVCYDIQDKFCLIMQLLENRSYFVFMGASAATVNFRYIDDVFDWHQDGHLSIIVVEKTPLNHKLTLTPLHHMCFIMVVHIWTSIYFCAFLLSLFMLILGDCRYCDHSTGLLRICQHPAHRTSAVAPLQSTGTCSKI